MSSYLENMNINTKDLLQALRLRREPESTLTDTVLPALAVFGAGLLVGAGIAMLVTPKSGRELRDDLSRRAGELSENVRNRIPAISNDESRTAGSKQGSMSSTGSTVPNAGM
jgi:hypothetical protein